MSLDMTTFAPMLKTLYSADKVENMAYPSNPLLAMMAKDESFYGENLAIGLTYADSQNRSRTFSTAVAADTNLESAKFLITRSKDHGIANVDNETILATENNSGAFLAALTTAIDRAMHGVIRNLAISMYRSGSGSKAQCNASVTGTSLQLKNVNDVTNFEKGMELVFSTADGGGSVKSGSVTVVAVNRDTGLLTVDALTAIDGGSGVAANDYIFNSGDYDRSIKGLAAWIPSTAPSATPFFSVDRSTDPTRLAGVRYDGSALPIEEAIIGAIHRLSREGGTPTHLFLNYIKWDELVKALGSRVSYIDEVVKSGNAVFSFRGVMVHGPKGPVKVVPDQNCPSAVGYLLQLDTWKLHSLKKAVHIFNTDGKDSQRQASSDGVQIRINSYAQVACKAPGYNAVILFE